jgi:hypothetical protein
MVRRVTLIDMIRAGVLSALLIALSTSSKAEERIHSSDFKRFLPQLQSAAGKNWEVTALPDGYLVTYLPLVRFYPAISESSKLDNDQRAMHGQIDHLQIRITLLYPPSTQNTAQFNSYWQAVHPAPGYFISTAEDWGMYGYGLAAGHRRDLFHSEVMFSANIPPDQLVYPMETVDVYEQALDALGPLFGRARNTDWD